MVRCLPRSKDLKTKNGELRASKVAGGLSAASAFSSPPAVWVPGARVGETRLRVPSSFVMLALSYAEGVVMPALAYAEGVVQPRRVF